jgi:hypothetical protein
MTDRFSGIHGRPYVPWDGVGPAPGVDAPGYCVHLSQLFIPWHRPYMALYEVCLPMLKIGGNCLQNHSKFYTLTLWQWSTNSQPVPRARATPWLQCHGAIHTGTGPLSHRMEKAYSPQA